MVGYILARCPVLPNHFKTSNEAKLSSERIRDLYLKIKKLDEASGRCKLGTDLLKSRQNLVVQCDRTQAANAGGSAFTFESISFEVSKSVNDALKQAFDNLGLKSNVNRVLALEPTEILDTLLEARRLIPVILRYLATYRDVTIIVGQSVLYSCNNDSDFNNGNRKDVEDTFKSLIDREKDPKGSEATQERPIRQFYKTAESKLDSGLDWELNEIHKISLLQHVNTACTKLDALARIDEPEYEGCTVDLIEQSNTKKTAVQAAVQDIIKP